MTEMLYLTIINRVKCYFSYNKIIIYKELHQKIARSMKLLGQ
jgi:hypothetical protein